MSTRFSFAALVVMFSVAACGITGGNDGPGGAGGKADDGSESSSTVETIFTSPFCDVCTSADKSVLLARSPIIARVVELIDNAEHSIDIAQFTFSRRTIEDAIVRANERGVTVRVAIDAGQDRSGSLSRRLRDSGVNVRFVKGRSGGRYAGLLHAKFMLADDTTLLTGSNNWSSTGTSINSENTLVIRGAMSDPRIAGFACHFEAIWESDTRHAADCSTPGVAFAPGSAGKNMIRSALREAKVSVDVLMHHLSFSSLVKELAKAQERGVQVRVVLNVANRDEHQGKYWTRLVAAGGELRYKQNNASAYQIMHHKLAIIDGDALYNGSGNWSGSGFYKNFENYVRYREVAVVRAFANEFYQLWTWSLSAAALDSGTSAMEQHADDTNVYFGNLHAHFSASSGGRLLDDGKGLVKDDGGDAIAGVSGATVGESARRSFEYARDMGGLDFMALTPHCTDERSSDGATMANMSSDGFAELHNAADAVTSTTFVGLAGMEWSTNSTGNHVNIFGSRQIAKMERGAFDQLYEDYLPTRSLAGDRPFVMFNHPRTMRMNLDSLRGSWDQVYGVNLQEISSNSQRKKKFNDYGLDDFAPLKDVLGDWISGDALPDAKVVNETLANIASISSPYVRLMEVTLGRGTELGSETAVNPSMSTTDTGLERRTKVHTDWDYYLLRGFRMAPTASHDNHWSNWGSGHTSRTGVIARNLSRTGLFSAIDRRQVFASEDEDLELRLYADQRVPMGSATATLASSIRADVSIHDASYSGGYEVTVYRGVVGGSSVTQVMTRTLAADGWLNLNVELSPGQNFFYVEVHATGTDRMAWSAPIWVERL